VLKCEGAFFFFWRNTILEKICRNIDVKVGTRRTAGAKVKDSDRKYKCIIIKYKNKWEGMGGKGESKE
jgi:hypothetical protein